MQPMPFTHPLSQAHSLTPTHPLSLSQGDPDGDEGGFEQTKDDGDDVDDSKRGGKQGQKNRRRASTVQMLAAPPKAKGGRRGSKTDRNSLGQDIYR